METNREPMQACQNQGDTIISENSWNQPGSQILHLLQVSYCLQRQPHTVSIAVINPWDYKCLPFMLLYYFFCYSLVESLYIIYFCVINKTCKLRSPAWMWYIHPKLCQVILLPWFKDSLWMCLRTCANSNMCFESILANASYPCLFIPKPFLFRW